MSMNVSMKEKLVIGSSKVFKMIVTWVLSRGQILSMGDVSPCMETSLAIITGGWVLLAFSGWKPGMLTSYRALDSPHNKELSVP